MIGENISVPGRYRFTRTGSERRYFTEEAIVEANSLEEAREMLYEGDIDWESCGDDWWDNYDIDDERFDSIIEEPVVKSKEFLFLAGYNG